MSENYTVKCSQQRGMVRLILKGDRIRNTVQLFNHFILNVDIIAISSGNAREPPLPPRPQHREGCIRLGNGLDDRGSTPGRGSYGILSLRRVQTGYGTHPITCLQEGYYSGARRPGREADHSPPSSTEVKECGELYRRSPQNVFVTWWLVQHRDNFTSIFDDAFSTAQVT
jgi:hypothetical protein